MRPFAVAGVQMKVRPHADNTERALRRIRDAVLRFPWIELVLLSELAVSGMHADDAQPLPGPSEDRFRRLAEELGIWLVPGSIYERVGERIYNTASVFDPGGGLVGRYRKMFPFQPYEPEVTAGDTPMVFDIPEVGRFGLSICYDLWFPEHSRWLASEGAEVILHPSLTDTIDRDVELAIVRATAAQNQCFVLD
ncbi:MAG: carbon-nitrogen hydrolase family protein, partial [Alphaproteobacteria bacterium]|nr:carbon-nitrogen hydrolase family protein [Alphaproteobacteria bacterium]